MPLEELKQIDIFIDKIEKYRYNGAMKEGLL